MPSVVTPGNLGTQFALGTVTPNKITIVDAAPTVAGAIKTMPAASYPAAANDTTAATPAYVTAAIAAIPAEKYLASVGAYNATTNQLTLNMNDGTTVVADLTTLVADAVASVPAATDTVAGISSLAVSTNYPSASNVEAATPAYVTAAVNGQVHVATGTVAPSAAPAAGVVFYINTATTPNTLYYWNGTAWTQVSASTYTLPAATDTVVGGVSLAVAANMPSTSDVEAATPAYVNAKLAQAGALPVLLTDAFGVNIARGGNP
jgi:hypothetical protein